MALAMHGPNGEYESVKTDAREKELREAGWIDGHEYWKNYAEKFAEKMEANEQALNAVQNKPVEEMTKAELLAVAKSLGLKVNPADKKEVILAAVKTPAQE